MSTPHPIESLLATAMESIKSMIDVNTILGDPVETADGTVILPVSRVSFGFAAGGKEFGVDGGTEGEAGPTLAAQAGQMGQAGQAGQSGQAAQAGQGSQAGPQDTPPFRAADPYAAPQPNAGNAQAQAQPGQGQQPPQGTMPAQGQGQPMLGQRQAQGQRQRPGQAQGQGSRQNPLAGWAAGGGAYSNRVSSYPFGGGSGAGVSLFPVAFLVVQKNEVRLITVDQRSAMYDRLLDLVPKILEWVRPSSPPALADPAAGAEPVAATPAAPLGRNHTTPAY